MVNGPLTALDIIRKKIENEEQYVSFYQETKNTFLLAFPEIAGDFNPMLKLSFTIISIDNKTPVTQQNNKNNDIYFVDGNLTFKKHVFYQLLTAGDVKRYAPNITRNTDSEGQVTFVSYVIDFEKLEIDGKTNKGSATGKYDYYADKNSGKTEKQINKRRQYADQLAETNSLKRIADQVFPMLRTTFSELKEVKDKILVAAVIKDFSEILANHPLLEQAYLAKMLGVSDSLSQTQLKSPAVSESKQLAEPLSKGNIEDAKIIEPAKSKDESKSELLKKEESKPEMQIQPTKQKSNSSEPTADEKEKIAQKEWAELDQEQRTKQLNDLIAKKGYPRQSKTPVQNYTVEKQYEMLKMLNNLPDKA